MHATQVRIYGVDFQRNICSFGSFYYYYFYGAYLQQFRNNFNYIVLFWWCVGGGGMYYYNRSCVDDFRYSIQQTAYIQPKRNTILTHQSILSFLICTIVFYVLNRFHTSLSFEFGKLSRFSQFPHHIDLPHDNIHCDYGNLQLFQIKIPRIAYTNSTSAHAQISRILIETLKSHVRNSRTSFASHPNSCKGKLYYSLNVKLI